MQLSCFANAKEFVILLLHRECLCLESFLWEFMVFCMLPCFPYWGKLKWNEKVIGWNRTLRSLTANGYSSQRGYKCLLQCAASALAVLGKFSPKGNVSWQHGMKECPQTTPDLFSWAELTWHGEDCPSKGSQLGTFWWSTSVASKDLVDFFWPNFLGCTGSKFPEKYNLDMQDKVR